MWEFHQPIIPNEPYAWTRDIFTTDELQLIINIGKSLPMVDGGVDNKDIERPAARRSKVSWIYPGIDTDFIFLRLEEAIKAVNYNFYNYDLTKMENLQFSEYDETYDGMYRNHTDDGFDTTYYRKLSFSLQLSSPDEYTGGDLLVYRFKLDEPSVVHKEKGLLAVFPSSTIHEVTPVTVGTRYSLVGWVHGPRFR
jgi:PKHD-type hydroxylase